MHFLLIDRSFEDSKFRARLDRTQIVSRKDALQPRQILMVIKHGMQTPLCKCRFLQPATTKSFHYRRYSYIASVCEFRCMIATHVENTCKWINRNDKEEEEVRTLAKRKCKKKIGTTTLSRWMGIIELKNYAFDTLDTNNAINLKKKKKKSKFKFEIENYIKSVYKEFWYFHPLIIVNCKYRSWSINVNIISTRKLQFVVQLQYNLQLLFYAY